MIHGMHVLAHDAVQPTKHIRLWDCGVTWRDINPSKGVFVWDKLDSMLLKGHKYLLVLGGTPQWAAKYPTCAGAAPWVGQGSNSPPADLRNWDAFVRAVSIRYKGRMDYQIWNEPQSKLFWYPDGFITLGTMTYRARNIIKANDPLAKVVAAPVMPRPSSGGLKRGGRYLVALASRGWPVDVLSLHIYPEQGMGPERTLWMIRQMKTALAAMSAPAKPLWCTEINYNLFGGALSEIAQHRHIRATDNIMKTEGISRCYWYAYEHSDPQLLGIPFTNGSASMTALLQLSV